jgi:hypothetical protein
MAETAVAALPPGRVDEAAWDELRAALPAVSERTLRGALRESGRELAPYVEGVRQESLEALRRTLTALAREYEAEDTASRKRLRALVITAKSHADLAARHRRLSAGRRALKQEMALWIRTWLLNPPLFPTWAELRARQCSGSSSTVMN